MRRRALLATVGSVVTGVAGCLARDDVPAETPSPDESPPDETDTDTPSAGSDDETDGPISVELRTVEYVISTYEVSIGRGIHPDDVVPEDEIPSALRDPLSEARDGGFETDAASEAVLAALDEFREYDRGVLKPHVELGGTAYEFEPTFPTFVAELEDEDRDDYDEDRLLGEDERWDLESEAVRAFVKALTASGTHVPRDEYRRCVVPDAVEKFLEEYDYLEDHRGASRIETTVRAADPPYTIELRELTDEDMWGRPVVEGSELDDELVAFFERALESDHRKPALPSPDRSQLFTDDVPDAYFDVVDEREFPYFRLDDTVYSISVGRPVYDGVPVSTTIEEREDADRSFALTISPAPEKADTDVEDSFTFTSRGALPSVLWITHDGKRHLLESPDYEKGRWRDAPDDSERDRRPSNEVLETADANDEISATYAVPDELPGGTYVSRGSFRLSWSLPDQVPGGHAGYPFELLISVE